MHTSKAFILYYTKYGDHDAVVKVFCNNIGYQSVFMRGIYAKKNKKISFLQPFHPVLLSYARLPVEGKLLLCSKIEAIIVNESSSMDYNIVQTSIRYFISDFLNKILSKDVELHGYFDLLEDCNACINEMDKEAHINLLFKSLYSLGIQPDVSPETYLNPENGKYQSTIAHPIFTQEISAYWKCTLTGEKKIHPAIKLQDVVESLMLYYQYHIPGFEVPQSLDIIREVLA